MKKKYQMLNLVIFGEGEGGGQNILYGVFNFSEYVVFIK